METKIALAEYPIEAQYRNFLFSKNGDIWVAYFLDNVYFPVNDPDFFKPYVNDGKNVLSHDEYEYHFINIPTSFSLKKHFQTIKDELVKGDLADVGRYYYDEAEYILDKGLQVTKYSTLLLAKLNTVPPVVTPKEYYELFKNYLGARLNEIATGQPAATQVAPSVYIKKEETLYQDLSAYKNIRRPSEKELEKVMYYFFHRGRKFLPTTFSKFEVNEGEISNSKEGYLIHRHIGSSYCEAFLPIIEMPSSLLGSGFIQEVQTSCYFPIETQIRLRFANKSADISHVRKMFKKIKNQIDEADLADAELDDDEVILEGDMRLKQLNRDLKREDRRVVNMSAWFVIAAPTSDELKIRINHLKSILKGTTYKIYQPQADQMTLFHQSLLGTPFTFKDYELKVTTGYVIDLGLDLYRTIGNVYGFPLGRGINQKKYRDLEEALAYSSQLIWFAPHLAKKNIDGSLHRNGNTVIEGPSGQGKSMLVKYIFFWLIFFGQKTLYIDPKNEMEKFVKKAMEKYHYMSEFITLCKSINFITISTEDRSRGMLDPLLILPTEQAKVEAKTILNILGEVNQNPQTAKKYKAIVVESLNHVMDSPEIPNNLSNVISVIKSKDKDLGTTIESYKEGIGKVIIGENNSKAIDFSSQVNVLGIQGLKMPTEKEKKNDRDNLGNDKIASEAIMDVIMHLVDVFSTNSDEDASIIFDEAKGFTSTPRGQELVDNSFRKGRAYNTDIYALTQSHSDNDSDEMEDLISYKFAFRPGSDSQREKVLNFFGMPVNNDNLEMLKNLKQGTCLFHDHMGRNQPIAIDVLFVEWLEAIKTTDTTDETIQRALELEKANQF